MLNKIIKLFIIFIIIGINQTFSDCNNPTYNINNVCLDNECYETSNSTNANSLIYSNFDQKQIKLKEKLDGVITNYKYLFKWYKYKIEGFCDNNNCTDIDNKYYKLDELLDISNSFKVKNNGEIKEYINGYNYFLRNYNKVLSYLYEKIDPDSWKEFSLKEDISKNIFEVGVEDNFLRFRNVCVDEYCNSTEIIDINVDDNRQYKYLTNGEIKNFNLSNYIKHENIDSLRKLSNSTIKAGSGVTVSIGFQDRLPTSGCSTKKYSYKIYNSQIKDESKLMLEENFELRLINLTISGTLDNQKFIKTTAVGDKVQIEISEPFIKTKVGEEYYYFEITDEDENSVTEDRVNYSPLEIIPGDPYVGNSSITTDYDRNLPLYVGDSFKFKIHLKDAYGNLIKDDTKGLTIDYNGLGNYLMSSIGNYQNGPISGVKNLGKDYFEFGFKPMSNGFYSKRFNVDYYLRDAEGRITNNISSFELIDESEGGKMYIDLAGLSNDFKISCTNKNITIGTKCTSDNKSGCNHLVSTKTKTFTGNGESGGIVIQDKAYNQKTFSYNIQHIDKILPEIEINNFALGSTYNIKATDSIILKLSDKTARACNNENYIKYKVYNTSNPLKVYYSGITNNGSLEMDIFLDILKTVGEKKITITVEDKYGNKKLSNIIFNIVPDFVEADSVMQLPLEGIKYANHTDFYTYMVTLTDTFGNPIKGKQIKGIDQYCNNYTGCKTIKTNMQGGVIGSGEDALDEYDFGGVTNNLGQISFKVKSYAPGIYNEIFKFTLNKWNDRYEDIPGELQEIIIGNISNEKSFKKLFTGGLSVSNDNGLNWTGSLRFGTAEKYKLTVTDVLNKNLPKLIEFNSEDIVAYDESKYSITKTDIDSSDLEFEGTINTSLNGSEVDGELGIKTFPNPIIKYTLDGKNILYRLTMNVDDYLNSPIYIKNLHDFIGVKIIGNLQGQGKQVITGQQSNFSDLSKQGIRDTIRKNAYKFINSTKTNSGTINSVKYITGDYSISGAIPDSDGNGKPDYETLVIINGNLTITGNLNIANKKLGIIILKDGYKVEDGYLEISKGGNIYVKPNVKTINALIYADGALISVDNNGHPYIDDTATRTVELQSQLVMNGSLFTRNTIGGSIYSGGKYLLPGGKSSNDFKLAMIYDLNYVRRGKMSCIQLPSGTCKYNGSFIIIYNPIIQTSPPKLFGK